MTEETILLEHFQKMMACTSVQMLEIWNRFPSKPEFRRLSEICEDDLYFRRSRN